MPPRITRSTRATTALLAALTLAAALVGSVSAAPTPEPRIIGGQPADVGEYPFMVALLYEPTSGDDFQKQYCGGSLISSTWVLTAAHCVDFLAGPQEVAVAIGRTDLSSGQGQRRTVSQVHIHPDYDPNLFSPDVALLKLAAPVTGITPIRLATSADDRFEAPGTPLTIIGWGNTQTKPNKPVFFDRLREIVVPVVADDVCWKANKRLVTTETQFCAGDKRADSCQGDSGGPIFATTGNGTRIQMGIVSWGFGCGKNHFPGVYTEINSPTVRNWIRSVSGI